MVPWFRAGAALRLPDPYILSLSVQVSSGPVIGHPGEFHAGGLDRTIWLHGVRLPGIAAALAATVVDREASPQLCDLEIPVAAMDDLGGLIRATGLPDREPRVKGRIDTSDRWNELRLTLTWNERAPVQCVVQAMSSGFEGPDAAALDALLTALSGLVGLRRAVF